MKYLIPIILLFYISCTKSKMVVSEFTEFKQNEQLMANTYKLPVSILVPRAMFITGNKLVIYKEKDEKLFDVFNLNDCQYLFSDGERGEGPNDFGVVDVRSFQPTSEGFEVLEAGSLLLKKVDFVNNKMIVSERKKMFDGGKATNGLYLVKDSNYLLFNDMKDKYEFNLYDAKKEEFIEVGNTPDWPLDGEMHVYKRMMAYIKNCVVHPDKSKIAVFYGHFKNMRILDYQGQLLHESHLRMLPFTERLAENQEDQWSYYVGQPFATSDFIYAVCANGKGNSSDPNARPELHVWDWEGNPVHCYSLDKNISVYTFCKKTNKMYAINRIADDEVYVYDLLIK